MSVETPVAPPPLPPAEAEPERARRPAPAPITVAMASVFALSLVAGFFAVFAFGLSGLQEQRSQHQLYARFRGLLAPASPTGPSVGGVIRPGTPVAMITAPAAGIHQLIVVEGTSSGDLLAGPGHLRDSPLPGQVGQSIVVGKSVTAGAPFRNITSLRSGDQVTVTTGQATFRFTVSAVRRAGDPLPVVPSGGSLLTLETSSGSGWLGSLAPSRLVYVDAKLDGSAVAAPAGRPVAVPVSEIPGRSDPGAWLYAVLWLQALLATGVAAVWSWSRWGHWQTWIVGLSVGLGVLWGLSDTAMRLLPNVV